MLGKKDAILKNVTIRKKVHMKVPIKAVNN